MKAVRTVEYSTGELRRSFVEHKQGTRRGLVDVVDLEFLQRQHRSFFLQGLLCSMLLLPLITAHNLFMGVTDF
jgi:hypothetical protein